MMRPKRRRRIPGIIAWPSRIGLLTKKSSWAMWSAQETSDRAASGCGPVALSTSTFTGPRSVPIAVTRSATWRSSVISAETASATPPSARMVSTTAAASSLSRRPLTTTAAPSAASRRAIALPRPRELPVTKATRRFGITMIAIMPSRDALRRSVMADDSGTAERRHPGRCPDDGVCAVWGDQSSSVVAELPLRARAAERARRRAACSSASSCSRVSAMRNWPVS